MKALLLAGVVVLSHLCIFGGEFVYDDIIQVQENPRIRSFSNIPRIFTTKYWPPDIKAGLYRPFTLTTYLIDYHLWGLQPWGFRLVNLLLHLAAVFLVLRLLERIGFSPPAAFLGALLFGVHPVHAETVTAVVGRGDILATIFVLSAVLLFIRFRERGGTLRLAGIGGCFVLGILSKELTVCLPLLLLGWDLVGGREPPAHPRSPRLSLGLVAPYLVIAVLLAVYLPIRLAIIGNLGPVGANTVLVEDPIVARWGTMLGVLFDYLKMFLLPVNLSADFPYRPGQAPGMDFRAALGGAVLIALVVAAARRPGRFGFSIAIFLFALAPVSNIVILTGIVKAARLLYLPSVGLSAIGGWLLWKIASVGHGPRAAAGLTLVLLIGLNMKTTTYWLDNETLWERSLRIAPDSVKGLHNLGAILATRGEEGEAERLWLRALSIDEGDTGPMIALGRLYQKQERFQEAEQRLKAALLTSPPRGRAIDGMLGLAEVFAVTGRPDEAEAQIAEIQSIYPDAPEGHFARGMVLIRLGRWPEAEEALRMTIALEPASGRARLRLGLCLYQTERFGEALEEYGRALPLLQGSDQAELIVKMGDAKLAQGDKDRAASLYRRATEIDPASGPAWNNLGQVLFMMDEMEGSREAFLRARALLPGRPVIPLRLGQIAASLGENEEARRYLAEVLATVDPGSAPLREKAKALLQTLE